MGQPSSKRSRSLLLSFLLTTTVVPLLAVLTTTQRTTTPSITTVDAFHCHTTLTTTTRRISIQQHRETSAYKKGHRYCSSFSCPGMQQLRMATEQQQQQPTTENSALLPQHESTPPPGEDDEKKDQSTGRAILELAVPAAGALLIDPLMTLADTAFVGRFTEGASPLAGLGSAAALLTFSFYLFNFLCTATTPLVAQRRSSGKEDEAVAVGGQALSLSLGLGAILCCVLFTLKQPLLTLMGTDYTGEAANSYALAFLSVRAFAAPAVLCIDASTGILRGYLDTKTPIFVLVAANIINLVLDVILIAFAGLGPLGAAIATTTAEWISAGLFLAVLAGKLPSAAGELGSNNEVSPGKRVSIVPLLSIPPYSEVKPLIVASSSVLLRSLVLQISLSAAAAWAARGGGSMATGAAASIAAHQIGIQLWLLGSFFCDSLAAASQGLVADALGREDPEGVRDVSKTVFQYSLILGGFLASLLLVGTSTGWLFDLFTQDPNTRTALSEILPLIILAQPLNALVFAADGTISGASLFPYQAKAMALSGATALASFAVLEYGPASSDTLVHVWMALLVLQLGRGLTSLWKLIDKDGPIDLFEQKSKLLL